MSDRALVLAQHLWIDAGEANLQSDPLLVRLHNSLILLAAIAPAVSARVVMPTEPATRDEEMGEFLNRNAWIAPYMVTADFALARLLFHATPWKVNLAVYALLASFAMTFCCGRNGAVRLVYGAPQETAKRVEKLARLKGRDPHDGLAAAH